MPFETIPVDPQSFGDDFSDRQTDNDSTRKLVLIMSIFPVPVPVP